MIGQSRELTVVRIPLRSAKHHFGASVSRGTRPYNEDAFQAGVIEVAAFAKKAPISLTRTQGVIGAGEGTSADSASGDPQVFYFGVFDGHGGAECSGYLREQLHTYIEESARQFELGSSLRKKTIGPDHGPMEPGVEDSSAEDGEQTQTAECEPQLQPEVNATKLVDLERSLTKQWSETVGGYFKRFRPEHFQMGTSGRHQPQPPPKSRGAKATDVNSGIEAVMTYAFLKADLDFITAQAKRVDEDMVQSDRALNDGEILGEASRPREHVQGPKRFKGGSTCSVAMVSTPTPTPFWHPASPSSLITAHVGDTRILLCSTASGQAVPLTTNHHPSSPGEGSRLRRYAATFVTDSFGEERMTGLANTRAFGDMQSKRIGVSAEPEIRRMELKPAEYSFMVLASDGITGTMSDQEIVDTVKEARTPDQGAKDVVAFATEVSKEGDNATCLVVRLGGWERRSEGGMGAMGTREVRDWRRQEAIDPRSRRT
ncbi:MAG: hypothetical protein M1832_004399 [Thelocarpon impressellum]|nr:MAG: hypothetical protein M1832_004399 [Thelocarpon impressellum]